MRCERPGESQEALDGKKQGCGAVDTSLLNCSIEVQWPTYGMSESSRHPSPFYSITVRKEVMYHCFEVDVRAIAVPCFRREEASLATSAMASNFW